LTYATSVYSAMHEVTTLPMPTISSECGTPTASAMYAAVTGYFRRNTIGATIPTISGSVKYQGCGRGWASGSTTLATNKSRSNAAMRAAISVSPTIGCAFIHKLSRRTDSQ
jgi:hypothetical protein